MKKEKCDICGAERKYCIMAFFPHLGIPLTSPLSVEQFCDELGKMKGHYIENISTREGKTTLNNYLEIRLITERVSKRATNKS